MTAAGWYPDPSNATQLRWWDGVAWTAHVAPATPPAATFGGTPIEVTSVAAPSVSVAATQALEARFSELRIKVDELSRERDLLQAQVIETRDVLLLQEVGMYQFAHPLDTSAQMKDALDALDKEIAACIKAG